MGDHRFELKIQFTMHGKTDVWDSWMNWDDSRPDEVAEWLRDKAREAFGRYEMTLYRAEKRAEAAREDEERAELARLRAKYG